MSNRVVYNGFIYRPELPGPPKLSKQQQQCSFSCNVITKRVIGFLIAKVICLVNDNACEASKDLWVIGSYH